VRPQSATLAALRNPFSTHYQVLGVSPGEVDEEGVLKAARRELALVFHPDRNMNGSAHDYTARVNVAYTVLSDAAARRLYDASLRTSHAPCATCTGTGLKRVQRGFTATKKLKCLGCAGEGWVRKL